MELIVKVLCGSELGIFGPILLILLVLWLARGDRSPWYIKAILIALLIMFLVIMFGS